MDPDNFSFPFDFHLPQNIPSSIEAEYGRVRYTLEAIIERPWSSSVKCIMMYTVLSRKDLNEDRDLAVRMTNESCKLFKHMPYSPKPQVRN